MRIEWSSEQVIFSEIDAFIADALRQIPICASSCEDKAIARLYPAPTGGVDEDADEDWREHVVPGLNELFQSHIGVVVKDLAEMREEGESFTLTFPAGHTRAWMHTLNQARLALGALHDITEADMEGRTKVADVEKSYALFQIEIYGFILSLMLQHTEL